MRRTFRRADAEPFTPGQVVRVELPLYATSVRLEGRTSGCASPSLDMTHRPLPDTDARSSRYLLETPSLQCGKSDEWGCR